MAKLREVEVLQFRKLVSKSHLSCDEAARRVRPDIGVGEFVTRLARLKARAKQYHAGHFGMPTNNICAPEERTPGHVIDDALARCIAPWRNLSGYLMGDPRFGYSMLDKMLRPVSASSIIPPITIVRDKLDDVPFFIARPPDKERAPAWLGQMVALSA